MTLPVALLGGMRLTWRGAALAALLSVALSVVLAQILTGGGPQKPPAERARAVREGLSSLPSAAQQAISTALGEQASSYRVSVAGAGILEARNPAQRLRARFARAGLAVSSGALNVGLSLRQIGYGTSLSAVDAVVPTGVLNRVSYNHTQVSEWYINGPLGLEQGFTLPHAPSGRPDGPLTLSLALSGNAQATAAAQSLTLGRPGARSLRYGSLAATDARGRTLHSWLELKGGHVLLRVASDGASYPLRIDPIIQPEPEQQLTGEDETEEARFGYSVALSADGNTALIGGPRDSTHFGAAWIFVRSGSRWTQQGPKLVGAEQSGDEGSGEHCGEEPGEEADGCSFGRSVALSADGNTAVIGNPRDSRFQPPAGEAEGKWVRNAGAAWVFTREATSEGIHWKQQGPKLTGGEERGEGRFGRSVSLSADGHTALIGGSSDEVGHGAAWVFTRSGEGPWTQQGRKLASAEELGEAHLGASVALSGDGQTALVAGPGNDGYAGAVWVFTRPQPTEQNWREGTRLVGGGERGSGRFGYRVALSQDGSTALVGGRSDDEGRGAAWVFTRSGSSWSEQGAKLTGAEEEGEEFGSSVALSSDGNAALVGAPRVNAARGSAWLFERSGTGWIRTPQLLTSGESGKAWFGYSVALSSDAKTALVGAPSEQLFKGARAGAVWLFAAEPRPLVKGIAPSKGPAAGGTKVTITGSNFEQVKTVKFGGADAASFTVKSRTEIEAVSPPGTGEVDVTVTNPNGTSVPGPADVFTYVTPKKPNPGETTGTTELIPPDSGAETAAGSVLAFVATRTPGCRVSLQKRSITVKRPSRAVLKLTSKGLGTCRGALTLAVKVRASKTRFKMKTIATGSFSVPSGKVRTVTLKLNAAGRTLLGRGHGRLAARLTILKLTPAPRAAQRPAVRLALEKPRSAGQKK
jgi:IPT/TIG domain/FG-GAP repeat